MSTVDTTTQYLVIVVTTLLFSVLAVTEVEGNFKKLVLQWIAAITWFMSGIIHLTSGDITSVLTYAPTYLFVMIGFLFTFSALYNVFGMLTKKEKL